ncbi:hypothetical protein GTR04_1494 [Trichophyton interdigitale]|uniref:Uncharacterized protein n=4 Tax=Trichophyton TaxID=5550 RepID=A0A9P5CZS9_9EURO|nr:hypothetical protein TESG_08400 [Trichophyton tonsurans CBS 112818]EGE08002.1 hypothetical protein TEQG_06989 [Trichophyton equinum CBS 127.97]KAF3893330.1 hypothetical protein GY631_3740 [Trichophyton interdigitale]KDB20204.1 hypothetical protein H109_07831 [Trichophyton interdigitale MR816]KAF3900033.1 hypothetical protein GY632_1014 [Trichophyton interdigitale]
MPAADGGSINGNLVEQISKNLTNTRYTFGVSSKQYQTVLEMLKASIADLEKQKLAGRKNDTSDVENLILLLERELKI